jgi:hypothetical protein
MQAPGVTPGARLGTAKMAGTSPAMTAMPEADRFYRKLSSSFWCNGFTALNT